MHRNAIAIILFIIAASMTSVPAFATDHRHVTTARYGELGGCRDGRPSTARGDQIAGARLTSSDPLGRGGAIYLNSIRIDSACAETRGSAWPATAKRDSAKRQSNGSGADRSRVVADNRAPRGLSDGPLTGARKLENVPIVRDKSDEAQYRQERRNPTGGVEDDRQDGGLSLLQNSPRPVPGTTLARNDGREEQWVRLPERTIPEPGAWAVLIAGLLGICAVARPRIFPPER